MIDPHIAPVGSETLNRQQIHVELRQRRERFHAILDSSTAGELRQPSNGTRWDNEELLFHMLFGYIVVVVLIRIIKTLGLLPRSTTKPFALLLNASTRPFNAINYWGARLDPADTRARPTRSSRAPRRSSASSSPAPSPACTFPDFSRQLAIAWRAGPGGGTGRRRARHRPAGADRVPR